MLICVHMGEQIKKNRQHHCCKFHYKKKTRIERNRKKYNLYNPLNCILEIENNFLFELTFGLIAFYFLFLFSVFCFRNSKLYSWKNKYKISIDIIVMTYICIMCCICMKKGSINPVKGNKNAYNNNNNNDDGKICNKIFTYIVNCWIADCLYLRKLQLYDSNRCDKSNDDYNFSADWKSINRWWLYFNFFFIYLTHTFNFDSRNINQHKIEIKMKKKIHLSHEFSFYSICWEKWW